MGDTRTTIEAFLGRVGARDMGLVELLADKIDWFVPGEGLFPWGGPRSRRDEIPAFFEELWGWTRAGETRVLAGKLLVDGEDAVFVGRFSHVAEKTGKRFEVDFVFDITVVGGRITRLHMIEDTLAAARAFELV